MTLNELIARANTAYPDGLIAALWDPLRQAVLSNANVGDTLALFVVRELKDTFDPEAQDTNQLSTAAQAMQRATNELLAVRNELLAGNEAVCRGLIQCAQALHQQIFVDDCYAAHDLHEYDTLLSELEKRGYLPVNLLSFAKQEAENDDG